MPEHVMLALTRQVPFYLTYGKYGEQKMREYLNKYAETVPDSIDYAGPIPSYNLEYALEYAKALVYELEQKNNILELNLKHHRINRQAGELSSKTGRSHGKWGDKTICCPCSNLPLASGLLCPLEL
jgi:hypothetical protein